MSEEEKESELREACLWCAQWNNGECKPCREKFDIPPKSQENNR